MADNKTEKQLRILAAVTKIHRSVGANLELEKIGRILVEELVQIVGCTGCAILLIEGSKVKILAERGFSTMLGEEEFSSDMPAIKYIADAKQSIHTGDIVNSPAASCIPAGCSMNSLICTPIVVKDQVEGIVHLDSPDRNAFDEEDLHFVELLTTEISVAIERSLLYSQVKSLSIRDGLTGCFNRRKFDEDIEVETARAVRYQRTLSLFMIDIDWFKKYNDSHGHSKGDTLLKKIAGIFTNEVRVVDSVYRYGGEEFVVLLPETDTEKALPVARRLREIVEQEQFEGEEQSQPNKKVTISIGVASFRSDADGKDELLKSADSALYRAKESGRNRVCVSAV